MEAVPDMDDLLDEMEANLIHETRKVSTQPPPQENKENGKIVKVQRLLPNPKFHENLEGEVKLEVPEMPSSFKPKSILKQMPVKTINEPVVETIVLLPEKQEIQIIKEDEPEAVKTEAKTEDVEYDEMLDYLNGFEDKEEDIAAEDNIQEVAEKIADKLMDEISDSLEEILTSKMDQLKDEDNYYSSDHGDEGNCSVDSSNDHPTDASIEPETQDITMSDESEVEVFDTHVNVEPEDVNQIENDEEPVSTTECEAVPEVETSVESSNSFETSEESTENSESQSFIDSDNVVTVIEVSQSEKIEQTEEENKEKIAEPDNSTDKVSPGSDDDNNERVCEIMEIVVDCGESSQEEEGEESSTEETRPRFDSSIATVHVLHESDSEDSPTPRRERRLTESELQLGKTCPYWIPDSDCPLCMLCNSKFTIITRRHHCRACGRVLCGSCCNEKAVLEYLNEEGKKPQAVRVCQPCSTMLSRIEAFEQEEEQRRSNAGNVDSEETSEETGVSQVPKGVLKNRPIVEDDSSTSNNTPSSSEGGSTRKGVMFRDGVRPGAHHEEVEQEAKSTALKPKKKSRKRNSVVKRCAELRMEDELLCALPNETRKTVLIVSPENDQIVQLKPAEVCEKLGKSSMVTIVLKKNLSCIIQIVEDTKFGNVWAVSTQGFAQIGLDELFFSWNLNTEENEIFTKEISDEDALKFLPLTVLHRISSMFANSTDSNYAGVRRVESRSTAIHTVPIAANPLPKHIMFFRPTMQDFSKFPVPTIPFLVACFLHDDELQWATACPDRVLHRLGLEYGCYPCPIVNKIGRQSMYTMQTASTVLKVFTDFRSWSYRMKHLPGCTVSLTNEKTLIRIPRALLSELREIITWNRSMLAWRCDISTHDDSLLICDENDGFYTTQVFAKSDGKRDSTSASFVILDGGSKVNSLQVNVVEDGVTIRVQSERLETMLASMQRGNNIIESSKDMEFRVEFFDDEYEHRSEYIPKSSIDGRSLLNKYQYGLSLDRALTQVLQVQGVSDYGVRLSHVFNLTEGRLSPDEEPKIYGLVEISARECVAMLEPYMRHLVAANIGNMSIRFFVSSEQVEYDVSSWLGLEEENMKFKQSLDQLIPMLYNMTDVVPNGFEVEMVLSIVSTRPLPI